MVCWSQGPEKNLTCHSATPCPIPNTQTMKTCCTLQPMPYACRAERPQPLPASLLHLLLGRASTHWRPLSTPILNEPNEKSMLLPSIHAACWHRHYIQHPWMSKPLLSHLEHCIPKEKNTASILDLNETGVIYQSSSWQSTPHSSKCWILVIYNTSSCSILLNDL